jgi:hypothetical protein
MNTTESPKVTAARNAVQEAASRLATIQSSISYARQNIAEVTIAECKRLLADCEVATNEVALLCRAYDKAVMLDERRRG